MSRIAAYLGPRAPAARILEGGSYSLVAQAREFPDGFGLGWYPEDDQPEPVRVISTQPAWRASRSLDLPRRYYSTAAIACVQRTARDEAARATLQPFARGPYLFAHAGALEDFAGAFLRPLRERLSEQTYRQLGGSSESELVFATWVDAMTGKPGPNAVASALESMVSTVDDIAHASGRAASLAVVVTDGTSLVTLRTATEEPAPALYTTVSTTDDAPLPKTGRILASEPLFAGEWTSLDTHSLVIFSAEDKEEHSA